MRYQIQTRFTPPFVQGSSTNALSAADASFLSDKPSLIYTPLSSDKVSSAEFLFLDHDHALEKVYHHNELGVSIGHGVAQFWSCGKWESAPCEQWAWKYLTAVDDDDMWQRLWVPVLLTSISTDYEPRKARPPLSSLSLFNASDMSSGRVVAASWVFDLVCSKVNRTRPWYDPDDEPSDYEKRNLARTCRLICRDWTRRLPLGDPMLKVAEGAVWYQTENEWLELPKRYWAWTFGPLEWWVERRRQDNIRRKWRRNCKAWHPKIIWPIDDMIRSKGKGRSMISSLLVTKEGFRTRLAPSIGHRFLENVRDLDDGELYRTCRLVCRDWVARYPARKPDLCNFNLSGGTMRYWTTDHWHLLPNKYWAWMIEDVQWWAGRRFQTLSSQKLGGKSKGWHPKLIRDVDDSILESGFSPAPATDSLECKLGMDRPLLHRRNSSDTRIRDMPAAMKMIASRAFEFISCAALATNWRKVTPNHEDRELARTCRLVCRDWARELSPGDPRLKVAEGGVWCRFDEEWQYLPKSYWAWMHQEIEWWMKKSQLDNVRGKYREQYKTWYPRLIQPVDDLIQSGSEDWSMTLSMAITAKPSRTHLEASIGPCFLEYIHNLGDKVLYRTCRLVCRDWARRSPFRNPERARLRYSRGVALYCTEGNWRVLPDVWWAWAFEDVDWWTERRHSNNMPREHMKKQCSGKGWVMKLVQPVDDCIGQDLSIAPFPARRHRRTIQVASALPPELFRYICNAADHESWSSRLVCRYWNRQCTPHVFANVYISGSPERIRALWQSSRDPQCRLMPHVKMIKDVPEWIKTTSRFPWLHLLTQLSPSVGVAWEIERDTRDVDNAITIHGPIGGGHRTIRSVHFGLPRSPRSFSRGVRFLRLDSISFKRFDDLANMVCELPDLKTLECNYASFTSILTDLPHRRPRRCRNNLRDIYLHRDSAHSASKERPTIPILLIGLSLYLRVYDSASFFSENEIASLFALMQPSREDYHIRFAYTYDSNRHKLRVAFGEGGPLNVSLYSSRDTLKLTFAFDCRAGLSKANLQRFDDVSRTSCSKMPRVPIHTIFGLGDREKMLEFAEALLSRTGATTLHHYAVLGSNGWCQASLDSEELYGPPGNWNLWDVYPIEALGLS